MTPDPVAGPSERPKAGDCRIYFGDLHNHSSVGYAQGSLERAFDIAHNHLDFFAFTPHGYWHDIGHYENGIEKKWLDGFEVTKKRWPEVLEMVRRYDHYHTSYRVSDTDDEEQLSWYYLRAVQANNQIAWSSPIWVEPPARGTKVGAARRHFGSLRRRACIPRFWGLGPPGARATAPYGRIIIRPYRSFAAYSFSSAWSSDTRWGCARARSFVS